MAHMANMANMASMVSMGSMASMASIASLACLASMAMGVGVWWVMGGKSSFKNCFRSLKSAQASPGIQRNFYFSK